MMATVKRRKIICELAGLESLFCPCARLDAGTHLGLDQEVVSSLDDKYRGTHVATKVAWYIPCVRWRRGRASGRIYGGCT